MSFLFKAGKPNSARAPQTFQENDRPFMLGEKLGEGAQGEVYLSLSPPGRVVKLFHSRFLTGDDGDNLRGKLLVLRAKQPIAKLDAVAWPEALVFDKKKQWCGYVMRRGVGVSLADNALAPKHLLQGEPAVDRLLLADTALHFLRTLRQLHAADVWVGDFNPGNFLFDRHSRRLFFLDVDSYQVATGGGRYVCPLTTPGMTPPEYLNVHMQRQWRSPESELFAGAIIAFLILMTGKHPFDAIGVDTHQVGLQEGCFAYRPRGEPPTGRIPAGGLWEAVWNDFPSVLQKAFTAIFLYGHRDPAQRGTFGAFIAAVEDYRLRLVRGEGIRAIQAHHQQATIPAAVADLAKISVWLAAKPQSRAGRILWWLVG